MNKSTPKMKKIYECVLPMTIPLNRAYKNNANGRGRSKSKDYKEWLLSCDNLMLPECGIIHTPVFVQYDLYYRDGRSGDNSNYIKLAEDYLVSQGVLIDDKHTIVQDFRATFMGYDKNNPRIIIKIFDASHNEV